MSYPRYVPTVVLRPWRSLFTSLLLLSAVLCMGQMGITVHYFDGAEQGYSVEASGKLQFNADELLIAVSSGSPVTSIPLSIIRKVTFGAGITTTVEERTVEGTTHLFPNPTVDFFTVASTVTGRQVVRIHALTGQEVLAGTYDPGQPVPVAGLQSGIYIVTVNNVPFKLVKQ